MIPVKNETIWPKTVGGVTPRRKVYELNNQTNKQHIVVEQPTSCLKQAVAKKTDFTAAHITLVLFAWNTVQFYSCICIEIHYN